MPDINPKQPTLALPRQLVILQRLESLSAMERTLAARAGMLREAYRELLDIRDRLARVTKSTPDPEKIEPDDVHIAPAGEQLARGCDHTACTDDLA